jgi:hypothetical protein
LENVQQPHQANILWHDEGRGRWHYSLVPADWV